MTCFGISNCLWKPLQERHQTGALLMYRSFWTVTVLALALIFFRPEGLPGFTTLLRGVPWIALSLLGLWCFVRSTTHQPSGVSGTLILSLGLFGALAAWLGAGDAPPRNLGILVILYGAGVLLIDHKLLERRIPTRGTLLALTAAACWAIANLGFKQLVQETGLWTFSLLQESVVFVVGAVIALRNKAVQSKPVRAAGLTDTLALALFTLGGVLGCNLSIGRLSVMQFAWISAVQPVATLFVAALFLGERLPIRQLIGGLILIAAAILSAYWTRTP